MADDVSILAAPSLTVRPTARRARTQGYGPVAAWTAFTLLNLTRYRGWSLVVMTAVVIGSIVAFVVLARRWARGTSLSIVDGVLRYCSLLGTRVVPGGEIERIVVVTVIGSHTRRHYRRWVLLGRDGVGRFAMEVTVWDEGDLRAVAKALGARVVTDPQPRGPAQTRRVYPRSVSWPEAHPILVAFVLIAALSVVMAVVSAVSGAAVT